MPRLVRPFVLVIALLAGCDGGRGVSSFVRPGDDNFARAYFDSVRAGHIDYAVSALGPIASGVPGVRDSLVRLAAYLPAGTLDSVHIIGVNRFESDRQDRTTLTYEYHSAAGWGAATILIAADQGPRTIEGIHADRLERSLEQANAFTFAGKSGGHYLMLALVLTCIGSGIWVAVAALRTKMKRRWAWALLALVGAGTIGFNWTTGQVGFRLLSLLFFNGAATRVTEAAPWILQVAFPIGAIMTWRHIQQARNPAPPTEPVAVTAPSTTIGSPSDLTRADSEPTTQP